MNLDIKFFSSPATNFFTAYVTPSGTLIVGLIVAIIAYRQWKTARDKLRLDLYERRLGVYDAAVSYLAMGLTLGESFRGEEAKVRTDFTRAWREARFLFGKDSSVESMLADLHKHVHIATTRMDPAVSFYGSEPNKTAWLKQYHESVEWLALAGNKLSDAVEPFLDFHRL